MWFLGLTLASAPARADHEAATPRNVVEKQLGPLRIASPLPQAFLGCRTHIEGLPEEENLAYFDLPDSPTNSAMLSVTINCLDESHRPVACSSSTPRFVAFLCITRHPHWPERIHPRCKLPLAPEEFITSRGIALGDSIQKVLSRYGPASVHNKLAQQNSQKPFYIVYTKGADTGDDREVLFRFENRSVGEIMITMGGEGDPDWSKELSNTALQTDGASRRR
jgi:hypothetical protein